jgi:DNA replication and repair protein RecF
MIFDLLKINNVRNISDVYIEPNAFLNIVIGPNASGKTALLEAIHLLARAKSFRTPRIKDVIQYNKKELQVVADVKNNQKAVISTGIEKSHGSTLVRYNSMPVKTISNQANNIPLVLITPDSHQLVTGSPKQRRHWLDWAMFHVEQTYLRDWKAYHKALRNRNIVLKNGGNNQQISSWESCMLDSAEVLNNLRREFIDKLSKQFSKLLVDKLPGEIRIVFDSGYPDKVNFAEYLAEHREQDRKLGYTKFGSHKADIRFLVDENKIAQVYSRGQIKRFVTLFLLAQARTFELINKEKPVFLIDDYGAELDSQARIDLLSSVVAYGGQIFITSTEKDGSLSGLEEFSMFHVERGNFNKVVK